jgi:SepF-like predicted cell division protein (DUF552 family)
MPAFGLFNKQKKQVPSEQSGATIIQKNSFEQTEDVAVTKEVQVEENSSKETISAPSESSALVMAAPSEMVLDASVEREVPVSALVPCNTYLKAVPLRDLSDLVDIKVEIQMGNILILRISPLASKSVESVKSAVNELYAFVESIGGDIARLGEERIVICPKNIRIWREKVPVKAELLPSSTVV